MAALAGAVDLQTVITVVVAVLLALLSVIGWFIRDMLAQVRRTLETNTRHLQSLMTTQWSTIWRVSSLEDASQDRWGYRPPRLYADPTGDHEPPDRR